MRQINESVVVSEACERLLGEIRKSSLKLNRPAWQARGRCQCALRCCDLQVITVTSNFAPRSLPTEECPESHPHLRQALIARVRADLCDEKNRRTAVTCRTDRGSSADGTSLFTVEAVEDRAIIMTEYS